MATGTEQTAANKKREDALAALKRGELVQLLAQVDAGRLDMADLEAAIDQHEKKLWFRRLLTAILLGRRAQ